MLREHQITLTSATGASCAQLAGRLGMALALDGRDVHEAGVEVRSVWYLLDKEQGQIQVLM